MKWLDRFADSVSGRVAGLYSWIGGKRRPKPGPRIRPEYVEDLPEQPQMNTLYIAGEDPHYWAAAMRCPCGCGDSIHLNLLEQESPSWQLRMHKDGSVSLLPSVWRTKGCRSHFFVRNGCIEWCVFDLPDSSRRIRRR